MKKRFTDEQIVGFLREAAVGNKTIEQLARDHGFSPNSFYVWKRRFGAMAEPDVKRYRELEKENARLKRLVADLSLDKAMLKELVEGKW